MSVTAVDATELIDVARNPLGRRLQRHRIVGKSTCRVFARRVPCGCERID